MKDDDDEEVKSEQNDPDQRKNVDDLQMTAQERLNRSLASEEAIKPDESDTDSQIERAKLKREEKKIENLGNEIKDKLNLQDFDV